MFATGIENSVPTIDGGRTRIDEMESCGHYKRWQEDFALVEEMGISYLQFGPPIHKTWLGDGRYDWAFADETFADLKAKDILPIVDLCHFGVPDWVGNFQNPDFPELFAGYAKAFTRAYLFKADGQDHWLPVQNGVSEFFPKELKDGDAVTLYLLESGGTKKGSRWTWTYLVEDFKQPKK